MEERQGFTKTIMRVFDEKIESFYEFYYFTKYYMAKWE